MIEVKEKYTRGADGNYTRQPLRALPQVKELPEVWSYASNTAFSGSGDEFTALESLSNEAFDSWEESLKKRQ